MATSPISDHHHQLDYLGSSPGDLLRFRINNHQSVWWHRPEPWSLIIDHSDLIQQKTTIIIITKNRKPPCEENLLGFWAVVHFPRNRDQRFHWNLKESNKEAFDVKRSFIKKCICWFHILIKTICCHLIRLTRAQDVGKLWKSATICVGLLWHLHKIKMILITSCQSQRSGLS